MSSTINWDSILKKAEKTMNSNHLRKRVEKKVDDIMLKFNSAPASGGAPLRPIDDAAKKFIEVLQEEIQSCAGMSASGGKLGSTAVASLTQLNHGAPVKVGRNSYQISVSFADGLYRDSLYQGEVKNIAALLNTGYNASKRVYGTWHGDKIASLQQRDGAHFIENAIRTFMENYAREYGVVDIDVDDIYK